MAQVGIGGAVVKAQLQIAEQNRAQEKTVKQLRKGRERWRISIAVNVGTKAGFRDPLLVVVARGLM